MPRRAWRARRVRHAALVALALLAGAPAGAVAGVAPPPPPPVPVPVSRAAAIAHGPAVAPASAADRRRADELRGVARDALEAGGGSGGIGVGSFALGGVAWPIALVLALLVAVAGVVALLRRGPRRRAREAVAAATPGDEAAELEQAARRAEQEGEHRVAVVLWFGVGARRLQQRGRARGIGPTATAGQIARASGDDRVGALARDHDRAAYGPLPVGPAESRRAREGWASVLDRPAPDLATPDGDRR